MRIAGFIALGFVCLWIIIYPKEFYNSLMFQYLDTSLDRFMTFLVWAYVLFVIVCNGFFVWQEVQ